MKAPQWLQSTVDLYGNTVREGFSPRTWKLEDQWQLCNSTGSTLEVLHLCLRDGDMWLVITKRYKFLFLFQFICDHNSKLTQKNKKC